MATLWDSIKAIGMIDHIAIDVSNIEKSIEFYTSVLAPLGYKSLFEKPQLNEAGVQIYGWGDSDQTDIWISEGVQVDQQIHIAFRADTRMQVDEFFKLALAVGGKDNGKPGLRPRYHENYYGAYVLDPDGHNIEAVCHKAL